MYGSSSLFTKELVNRVEARLPKVTQHPKGSNMDKFCLEIRNSNLC